MSTPAKDSSSPSRPLRVSRRAILCTAGACGVEGLRFGAIALAASCSEPDTGGRRVEFEFWLESKLRPDVAIDNAHGWTIHVSRAELGIEHLYFVTGDPVGGELTSWWELKRARAHPGHYSAGDTLGEMNRRVSFDLLGEPRRLLTAEGVTGQIRSCVMRFAELDGEQAAVVLEGVARKVETAADEMAEGAVEETSVEFVVRVGLDVLENSASHLPEVPGIPCDDGDVRGDGRITFAVDPSVWLNQIDFQGLVVDAEAGQNALQPGTQAHNAFIRGIQKAVAYRAAFQEKS